MSVSGDTCATALRGLLAFPFRHRRLSAYVLVSAAIWVRFGPRAGKVGAVALPVAYLTWRLLRHPRISPIVLGALRARVVYRPHWVWTMIRLGLASPDECYMPRLGKVRSTRIADRLWLRLAPGQTPDDIAAVCEAWRHLAGAVRLSSVEIAPGRVLVTVLRSDPLERAVRPLPLEADGEIGNVALGIDEAGSQFRLGLAGSHLLIAGSSGSGKSGVLWGLVRGLTPSVRAGLASMWVIDPKGGIELSAGQPLFARYADADLDSMADLLDEAVEELRARTARLRGLMRSHVPTRELPLLVVLVDELAALVAYCPDPALRKRMTYALHLLLTQGRAAGIVVVAAVQDPRKESLPFRDLFTARVALRLVEPESVDLILGEGARARGAVCDRISASLPGVGFVALDGQSGYVRVRFAHVSDADIAAIVGGQER